MTFNPKFTSYRSRIVGLALVAAFYGAVVLLAGHDYCHRGKDALAIAAILAASAVIPESPGKKVEPEKYPLTGD
jgi:hypothetical protein